MKSVLKLLIANDMAHLHLAVQDLDAFLAEHGVAPALEYEIHLAFEELIVNIIKYGYDDDAPHQIEVVLALGSPATMTIVDDGHPFNPLTDAPTPTLDAPIEDRPIGGLGLHLLRTMGLSMDYRREGSHNSMRITFPETTGSS
jgi:anti-sigma regulatory factor (Ser/Thr protein kinase)